MNEIRRTPTIVCFHGSPGIPDEFLPLEAQRPTWRFIKLLRDGYPNTSTGIPESAFFPLREPAILLGYSWGAAAAVHRAATAGALARGLVLVSPYFFLKKSSFGSRVISSPLVGTTILRMFAGTAARNFMNKSARPAQISSTYFSMVRKLANPQLLRIALLEKDLTTAQSTIKTLQELSQNKVPLGLIWGKEDRIGTKEDQILPLREQITFALEEGIEAAGHAIPWTHSEQLAQFLERFFKKINIAHSL